MAVDVEVVSGWTGALCVGAPGAALLAGSAVFGALRAVLRRRARLHREALRADTLSLRPGAAVALAGTAELLDGQAELLPVFLLKLESGVRVRVEATQAGQVKPGEQVLVRGVLQGAITGEPNAERATLSATGLSTDAFSGELDRRAGELTALAVVLLIVAVATQLFYLGFYVEALLHAFGLGAPPTIVLGIYFWVAVISGSVLLGATLSALQDARRA